MRDHWRELDYWRWLWRERIAVREYWHWLWSERIATQAKVVLVAFVVALLLGGGLLAADRLGSGSATRVDVLRTTVLKLVTVRERSAVARVAPVVTRTVRQRGPALRARTRTEYQTRVVTAPEAAQVVRRTVTVKADVPVVRKELVTVPPRTIPPRTRTVVVIRRVPKVLTRTHLRVVTDAQTVTDNQTVTTTEGVPVTVTDVRTKTRPAQTETVTQTVSQTVTEVSTVTQTVTQTIVLSTTTRPGR